MPTSTGTRWPELEKIKERYPEQKPAFLDMLRPIIPEFLEILRYQTGMLRGASSVVNGTAGPPLFSTVESVPANMLTGPEGSLVPDPYGRVTPEDKELMERLLAELGPEIRVQTEELIKTEIRDSMMLGGNWVRLRELLKSGQKKPKVVRKRQGGRDPLFLQFGDGVNEEIEEIRILG